jgi:hypothetical protein
MSAARQFWSTAQRQELVLRTEDGLERQPPDCIIIGAQKAGTKSLVWSLTRHPAVGGSLRGEDDYFSWHYDQGGHWPQYLARFPVRGEVQCVTVSSPSYLFHPPTAHRVRHAVPEVRLIALLRNPVDRAYSQYQMNVRKQIEPLSFAEAIAAEPERLRGSQHWTDAQWRQGSRAAYLTRGLYAEQVERWLELFPREQLLILKSEDFFQRPDEALRRTLAFLALSDQSPNRYQLRNAGTYEAMDPALRARLTDHFAPHNRRLRELVGEEFDWESP